MTPIDFTAIKQLKLKDAFAGETKIQKINQEVEFLAELFDVSNASHLYVYDDSEVGHSIFVNNTNGIGCDKMFIVENRLRKDVFLWHIDGVLFEKDSKCDCAILTNENLKFVEFKSNASNKTSSAIKVNYNKAYQQLSDTFKYVKTNCEQVGVNIMKLVKLEAYAVFNKTVPMDNALIKNLSVKFLRKNGIKLLFENKTNV